MRLARYHGLGNDYLVYEDGPALTPSLVVAICDRHRGVGSDGILEATDGGGCDHGVRIWNPDGSIAEKSGNGLRIFAQWLADGGAAREMTIWTGFSAVRAEVRVDDVRVEMGTARFPGTLTLDVDGPLEVHRVDMGNPHAVVFVDDPDAVPWRAWGAGLEVHPAFPNRTNVQVASVSSESDVVARIWERGAGETLASGSSSCAVAAAAIQTGRMPHGVKTVRMAGGTVQVTVTPDWAVELIGPVERVGTIDVDARWVRLRRS
jgi:diaminopimelate epimerase